MLQGMNKPASDLAYRYTFISAPRGEKTYNQAKTDINLKLTSIKSAQNSKFSIYKDLILRPKNLLLVMRYLKRQDFRFLLILWKVITSRSNVYRKLSWNRFGKDQIDLRNYDDNLNNLKSYLNSLKRYQRLDTELSLTYGLLEPFVNERIYGIDLETTVDDPKISIIICTYQNPKLVVSLLTSIRNLEYSLPFEVILVDDGSKKDRVTEFINLRGVHVYQLDENVGFLRASNFGASKAKGQYLWFVNDDCLLLNGAMSTLVEALDSSTDVAVAGSLLLNPDLTIQEAGVQIFRSGEIWQMGKTLDRTHPFLGFSREVDYVSGASLMVKRETWEALGGFDETFAPAYFEDSDFCLRTWKSGKKVLFCHGSRVVHMGGQSFGSSTDPKSQKSQLLDRNKRFFDLRWKLEENTDFWESPNQGLRFFANRASREVAVFVDHQIPYPGRDSGNLRADQIIHGLKDLGFHVIVVSRINVANLNYVQKLRNEGFELHPNWESFTRCHGTDSNTIKLFWVSRLNVLDELYSSIRLYSKAKLIYDTVDLHHLRLERLNETRFGTNGTINTIEAELACREQARVRSRELQLARLSDAAVLVGEYEIQRIKDVVDKSKLKVLWKYVPNKMLEEINIVTKKDFSEEKSITSILFVGSFYHQPNIQAIDWFSERIAPRLKELGINFKLIAVGPGAANDKVKTWDSGIEYIGWVEDLKPIYSGTDFVIAPLLSGAGLKGKVLESLAMGKPLIATSVAVEGFGLEKGIEYLHADTEEEFVSAICELASDYNLRLELSRKGQEFIRNRFSKDEFTSRLRGIINEMLCLDSDALS
jgi:GT2 family glycosyltransferase